MSVRTGKSIKKPPRRARRRAYAAKTSRRKASRLDYGQQRGIRENDVE